MAVSNKDGDDYLSIGEAVFNLYCTPMKFAVNYNKATITTVALRPPAVYARIGWISKFWRS